MIWIALLSLKNIGNVLLRIDFTCFLLECLEAQHYGGLSPERGQGAMPLVARETLASYAFFTLTKEIQKIRKRYAFLTLPSIDKPSLMSNPTTSDAISDRLMPDKWWQLRLSDASRLDAISDRPMPGDWRHLWLSDTRRSDAISIWRRRVTPSLTVQAISVRCSEVTTHSSFL